MATRLGVDVGGTFTDLIFYDDESGEVRIAKELTTPAAPEQGVSDTVSAAVPEDLVRAAQYFLHGTTVGLNSLLERKGAKVGLLATQGFRDILEVRRGDRDDPYDLFPKQPPPLVPRRLRLPVRERMRADGAVHTPLVEEDVQRAVENFKEEEVGSVAIAFLHSYANPQHELAAERAVRKCGFDGAISLSHQVSGEYREYERTCTTIIDAYVRPRMATYLRRLEERLAGAGFGGELLVTRSGGGAMTFTEAEARPFETILSGPVAGAEGAAELARNLQLGDVITADVGGTSFDTCLITGGRPQIMYEGKVVGLPVQTPWVDVRSIGAGGGSIAYVDVGGLLRVGPQSAGADPGPACYCRGGTQPTVTDSALVLGMLGEGRLASGIVLDRSKARAALKPLAEQLGFEVENVARGVLTIVTANMANAIREITVEQGQDPRRATLVAFGGAGPLFAPLLARELDIGQMVIPPYAGNFSAWGLLGADLTQTAARTRIMKLEDSTVQNTNHVLADLFTTLSSRGTSPNGNTATSGPSAARGVALDMRYVGQEHTITVAVESSDDGCITASTPEIYNAFTREYDRTFGHTMDEQVEIVSVRATLRTPLPRRAEEHLRLVIEPDGHRSRSLEVYSFTRGQHLPFQLVDRSTLGAGAELIGPAIILEETATTYLDAEFMARVHPSGALFVADRGRS
jgi:N-methylhydantoinase A